MRMPHLVHDQVLPVLFQRPVKRLRNLVPIAFIDHDDPRNAVHDAHAQSVKLLGKAPHQFLVGPHFDYDVRVFVYLHVLELPTPWIGQDIPNNRSIGFADGGIEGVLEHLACTAQHIVFLDQRAGRCFKDAGDMLGDGVGHRETELGGGGDGFEVGMVHPQNHHQRPVFLRHRDDAAVNAVRRRIDEDMVQPKFLHRVHDEVGGRPRGGVLDLGQDRVVRRYALQGLFGQFAPLPERFPFRFSAFLQVRFDLLAQAQANSLSIGVALLVVLVGIGGAGDGVEEATAVPVDAEPADGLGKRSKELVGDVGGQGLEDANICHVVC